MSRRNILTDPELWMVLLFNFLFLFLYLFKQLETGEIVWIYFIQSGFIGFQYFIRMFIIAWRGKGPGRYGVPFFFAFHFGAFHFVYLIFLTVITTTNDSFNVDTKNLLTAFFLLFLNLIFSTGSDIKADKEQGLVPGSLMFTPYLRIIPMHLFIIMGFNEKLSSSVPWFFRQDAFIVFLILKTITDVVLHILVNKTWKERRPRMFGDIA